MIKEAIHKIDHIIMFYLSWIVEFTNFFQTARKDVPTVNLPFSPLIYLTEETFAVKIIF